MHKSFTYREFAIFAFRVLTVVISEYACSSRHGRRPVVSQAYLSSGVVKEAGYSDTVSNVHNTHRHVIGLYSSLSVQSWRHRVQEPQKPPTLASVRMHSRQEHAEARAAAFGRAAYGSIAVVMGNCHYQADL